MHSPYQLTPDNIAGFTRSQCICVVQALQHYRVDLDRNTSKIQQLSEDLGVTITQALEHVLHLVDTQLQLVRDRLFKLRSELDEPEQLEVDEQLRAAMANEDPEADAEVVDDGVLLRMEHPMFDVIIQELLHLMNKLEAPNYITMNFEDKPNDLKYEVTVRNANGGLTPCDQLNQLSAVAQQALDLYDRGDSVIAAELLQQVIDQKIPNEPKEEPDVEAHDVPT